MHMRGAAAFLRRAMLVLLVLVPVACSSILDSLLGIYQGPMPDQADIVNEVVIVRIVSTQPSTGIQNFYLDRVRFLEANDPHNVNRVVEATARDVQGRVDELGLRVGDRIRISTRFFGTMRTAGLHQVPNWPGHDYFEYPIGFHFLTAVERVSP